MVLGSFFSCPYRFTVCAHSLLFVIRLRPLCWLLEILLHATPSFLVLWLLGSWAFSCSWTSYLTSLPCSAWAPQSTWSRMCLQAQKVGACVEFTSSQSCAAGGPVTKRCCHFAVHFFGCWWGVEAGRSLDPGTPSRLEIEILWKSIIYWWCSRSPYRSLQVFVDINIKEMFVKCLCS